MQLITLLSAASAIVASASADRSAVTLNQDCDTSLAYARVINRCNYPVYLWSVFKGDGCPANEMVTLNTGEIYNENLEKPKGSVGVSIKMSKAQECKGSDIVQLEYFLQENQPGYNYNYLDVSYVDCLGDNCPTKSEGYYLVAGSQTGAATASAGNTWCPILSCNDAVSCAKMSYILPDDVQTKTCDLNQNMDLYLCGGEAPTQDYGSAPASSSQQAASSAAAASSTVDDSYKVKAAAVTNAPALKNVQEQKTKTQVKVVYVTAYEYVNAKRHAHGHARRHQPFHA